MTEQPTSTGLVPNKPYFAIYKNAATAQLYDGEFKHIMYIDSCSICRHCIAGQENGGGINIGDCEQEEIWYYCKHPNYTSWPIRIGQQDKITTVGLGYQCPLDSMVRVNDSLIKITADEPKKERSKRTQKSEQSGQSEMPKDNLMNSVIDPQSVDQKPE